MARPSVGRSFPVGLSRKAAQHAPHAALKDVQPHVHIHLLGLREIADSVVDLAVAV